MDERDQERMAELDSVHSELRGTSCPAFLLATSRLTLCAFGQHTRRQR